MNVEQPAFKQAQALSLRMLPIHPTLSKRAASLVCAPLLAPGGARSPAGKVIHFVFVGPLFVSSVRKLLDIQTAALEFPDHLLRHTRPRENLNV
jgi:hypothetical protein